METLEDYLDAIPDGEHRQILHGVIQWAIETFPELVVEIKWNQPMLTHHGTFIAGFSAASQHFSMAPERKILDDFRDALSEAKYSHSKALFRIRWDQPVDHTLLTAMLERSIEFKKGSKTFWAH